MLHVGAPTCSWQMATVVREDSMRLTPAATAEVASPFSRALCARCPATRDEEQAGVGADAGAGQAERVGHPGKHKTWDFL